MKRIELEQLVENIVRKVLKEFDVLRDFVKIPGNGYFKTSDMYKLIKKLEAKKINCTSEISRYDHTKSWIRIKRDDYKNNKEYIDKLTTQYINESIM